MTVRMSTLTLALLLVAQFPASTPGTAADAGAAISSKASERLEQPAVMRGLIR